MNDVAADGAVRDDEVLVEGREPSLEARIRNLNAARRLSLLFGHRALNRVSGFEVVENAFARVSAVMSA